MRAAYVRFLHNVYVATDIDNFRTKVQLLTRKVDIRLSGKGNSNCRTKSECKGIGEREVFIDNLLIRIHFRIVMI